MIFPNTAHHVIDVIAIDAALTLPQTYLPAKKVEEAEYTVALLSRRGLAITSRVTGLAKAGGAFVPGVADADLFPFHIWKRLQNRYFRKNHMELTGYVEHGGYRRLREALASCLYASRAVKCRPEQIIITMGTHQSLDLVAKLLSDPGDSVLIETPCHWGAPVVFLAAGLAAQPIAIDSDGACLPELQLRAPRNRNRTFLFVIENKGKFSIRKIFYLYVHPQSASSLGIERCYRFPPRKSPWKIRVWSSTRKGRSVSGLFQWYDRAVEAA